MPLDALCLMPLTDEIKRAAEGAKIDKVQQPGKTEIILSLRGNGMSRRLLVSVSNGRARLHFTEASFENPQSPPMFCMLLRKYLIGARIASITQPSMERLVDIELDTFDEMGVASKNHLIVELIGVSANLILVSSDGIIIDCLRRVDGDIGEKRCVMPGLIYHMPPSSDKKNPLLISKEELEAQISSANPEKTFDSFLLDKFFGFSPLVCRELSQKLLGDTSVLMGSISENESKALSNGLWSFLESIKRGELKPFMLISAGKAFDFSCVPITQYGSKMETQTFKSYSEMLDEYYTGRELAESARQKTQTLTKTVKNLRDRTKRKLTNQTEDLKATFGRERLRELGDIITSNLHSMKPGMAKLTANDYYSEDYSEIEVRLDPRLTPQQNAAKYYKDYTKAKKAEMHLTEQIKTGETELDYLESVLDELSRASSEKDVEEIRRELEKMGFLSVKTGSKKVKEVKSKPLKFLSTSGLQILVGKNNMQNDELTFRMADRFDIWLHTQKIHGSHVIIMTGGEQADEKTIEEAAMLAAFYSQASEGEKVPVDYTQVRFVKKPSGAKPGMVIYTDYKTAIVTPDKKLSESLRSN